MNSPGFGWLLPLYLAALSAAHGASHPWWSIPELRRFLNMPDATALAHWAGPEPSPPDAAFLALHTPQTGVRSIVVLKSGLRVRFDGKVHVDGAPAFTPVTSLDVEGIVTGGHAIMFHEGSGLLRSAFSFDTGETGPPKLRFIVTGVAPGMWEVWRNGWVVDPGVPVRAGEALLCFDERPGSYFVRKLN